MDPQDVTHLFYCTVHPNDLSPVNLWDKPFETIRELSFLEPDNLTSSKTTGICKMQSEASFKNNFKCVKIVVLSEFKYKLQIGQ